MAGWAVTMVARLSNNKETMEIINLQDFKIVAMEKMLPQHFDYCAGGAEDEITLRANKHSFGPIKLHQRVLRNISSVDTTVEILGQTMSMPVMIAPTAFQGLAHQDAEIAMVKAAGTTGVIMILSTLSNKSLEDVLAAASAPVWFQIYMYKEKKINEELIKRAENAGCSALVITVDLPVQGKRESNIRNRFTLPPGLAIGNFEGGEMRGLPDKPTGSGLMQYISTLFKHDLSWQDIKWLRSITDLPLIVKGILHVDDARLALEHGVNGIIVSNHGGRQLDNCPATIDVLAEIVQVINNEIPVILDGGIRRGSDVVKALAFGASATAIGRPTFWGLAVDGKVGVETVFSILKDELANTMAFCGVQSVSSIGPDIIV